MPQGRVSWQQPAHSKRSKLRISSKVKLSTCARRINRSRFYPLADIADDRLRAFLAFIAGPVSRSPVPFRRLPGDRIQHADCQKKAKYVVSMPRRSRPYRLQRDSYSHEGCTFERTQCITYYENRAAQHRFD